MSSRPTLIRLVLGVGVVVVAVAAIAAIRASVDDADGAHSAGPVPSLPTESAIEPVGPATKLGVFEAIRGWIVYPVGNGLKAVNPADPTERRSLELPDGLDVLLGGGPDGGNRPSPAGWAADGTTLALSSEYSGDHFVMKADGSLRRVSLGPGGCCLFVTEPWLSPDGFAGLEGVGADGIRYVTLGTGQHAVNRLEPPLAAGQSQWQAAWSSDGSRIAFITVPERSNGSRPMLHVADFWTGDNHALATLEIGHVRHIVWSPDDSQLLVVAGLPLPPSRNLNPLVAPLPTKLLLVDTDGSDIREIASGYFVATAWSPDGEQIAAIEYSHSGRRLVLMDADGTDRRVLVELPANELFTGLAWHPLSARD